jgi:DNA-binding MarR family transcriptional regulator
MIGQPDETQGGRAAALSAELRAVFGKLKRRLREQADVGDLTPSQVSALLRLETDGPATTSNLARAEGMRPQSMASVVAALEAAGLVSGAPDPKDGRQTLILLTETCRTWIREGRAARQDWLARKIQAHLSSQEQEVLTAAVELLKRLADE